MFTSGLDLRQTGGLCCFDFGLPRLFNLGDGGLGLGDVHAGGSQFFFEGAASFSSLLWGGEVELCHEHDGVAS